MPFLQDPAAGAYSKPDESNPHSPPHSPKIHLILLFHFPLSLPSGLYPSGFTTKTSYSLPPCALHALDLIIVITFCEVHKLSSPSVCDFPHPPVISSLFRPKILFRPCSQTPCFLLLTRKRGSLSPIQTIGKIILLYIVIFTFVYGTQRKNSELYIREH